MTTHHDNLLWRGLKITMENGNKLDIVHDYPGSVETFYDEWLKAGDIKTEWAFLEFLNKKWKGEYAAFSMAHFKFLSTNQQNLTKEEWSHAYFELSGGIIIDIMHNIQGTNKNKLITGAIESWVCKSAEFTEQSFLEHFNKFSGFKAISTKDYTRMN